MPRHVIVVDGQIPIEDIGTGTPDGTKFLRDDGVWTTPAGVTDHGALTGRADDDHAQYHNDARGDARYSLLAHLHTGVYEPAGTAAAAVATHAGLADPHPVYLTTTEANALYALAAAGVTNGDAHDHSGGDGAQIAYGSLSGTPTLGGAASLNVGTTAGTVAAGDDARLSDARTPTAHNQAWSTITATPTTLAGYSISDAAPLSHVGTGGAAHADVVAAGAAGFMTGADKTKLDGIAAGAQVNVATDLSYTAATRLLASSTGTDATLPLFTSTEAGLTPLSGGGTSNFLRADGSWAAPAGGPGGSLSTASIPFTNGDTVQRVTVTDAAVTALSKVHASIRRPDQADASADAGFVYIANIVRVAAGAFDAQVVCLGLSGDDVTESPPNETLTLTYMVA